MSGLTITASDSACKIDKIYNDIANSIHEVVLASEIGLYDTSMLAEIARQINNNIWIHTVTIYSNITEHHLNAHNLNIFLNNLHHHVINLTIISCQCDMEGLTVNAIVRFLDRTIQRFRLKKCLTRPHEIEILKALAEVKTLTYLDISIVMKQEYISELTNVLRRNKQLQCIRIALYTSDSGDDDSTEELFNVISIMPITRLELKVPRILMQTVMHAVETNKCIQCLVIVSTVKPNNSISSEHIDTLLKSKNIKEINIQMTTRDICKVLNSATHITSLEFLPRGFSLASTKITEAMCTNLTLLKSDAISNIGDNCRQYLERNNVIRKHKVHKIILDVTTVLYPILNAWVILEIILHQCAPYQNYIARTFIVDTIFAIIRSINSQYTTRLH